MIGTLEYFRNQFFVLLLARLSMWCGLTTAQCAKLIADMEKVNLGLAVNSPLRIRLPTADEISPLGSKKGDWMTDACICPGGRPNINLSMEVIASASRDPENSLGENGPIRSFCKNCHPRVSNIAIIFLDVENAYTKDYLPGSQRATLEQREHISKAIRVLVEALSFAPVEAPYTALLTCSEIVETCMLANPW